MHSQTMIVLLVLVILLVVFGTYRINAGHAEGLRLSGTLEDINEDLARNDLIDATRYSGNSSESKRILDVVVRNDLIGIQPDNAFISNAFMYIAKRNVSRVESIYYNKALMNGRMTRSQVLTDILGKDSGIKEATIERLFEKYIGRAPTFKEREMYSDMMKSINPPPGKVDYSERYIETYISKLPEAKFRRGVINLFFKYLKRVPTIEEYAYFHGQWKDMYNPITLQAIERILMNVTPGDHNDYLEIIGNVPGHKLYYEKIPLKTYWTSKRDTLESSYAVGRKLQAPINRIIDSAIIPEPEQV